MFSEMRTATIMAKIADSNYEAASAGDVFAASNLAGAEALGRPDLGRIAAGAKADIVIVDPQPSRSASIPDPSARLFTSRAPENDRHGHGRRPHSRRGRALAVADQDEILAAAAASSQKVWGAHAALRSRQAQRRRRLSRPPCATGRSLTR